MDTTASLLASIERLGVLVDDIMPLHPDLHAAFERAPSPFAADSGYSPSDSEWDDGGDSDFDDAPALTPDELRQANRTFLREDAQVRMAEVAWQHRSRSIETAFSPFATHEQQPPATQVESIRAKLQQDADAHVDALMGYDELPRDMSEMLVDVPTMTRN